ncbi:hypothetical protein [Salinisphaera orenii]|uniref:Uncharacterized protein n=1 Tax=Salinisphaera orenii YIM 95161 TaxID=1051139 RepID=A0A423PRJ0_9GAMM|nr:hypothetical protein [Salinisphaera halophila]ROO28225.1 hypothetical protein SAHL_10645 [Salinisphaera halophila YIM 95161]
MTAKRWKKRQPNSMQEALRLCLDYAAHKHNRSVQRVADLNGISEWVIYKWMSDGSIPSRRIPPFEMACDCHYVTAFLAHSAHKLLVDIPRGSATSRDDLLDLQNQLNDAVQQLRGFTEAPTEDASNATIRALTEAMTALAGHRANVQKAVAQELALFDGGDA